MKNTILVALIIIMVILLSSCSALDLASNLMPSKPAVEANLEIAGEKNQAVEIGGKELTADTINETIVNNGAPALEKAIDTGMIALLMFLAFQVGLRTPRPKRYTSEGRK